MFRVVVVVVVLVVLVSGAVCCRWLQGLARPPIVQESAGYGSPPPAHALRCSGALRCVAFRCVLSFVLAKSLSPDRHWGANRMMVVHIKYSVSTGTQR